MRPRSSSFELTSAPKIALLQIFQAVEVGVKRVEELTIVSLINDPHALQIEQLISILYETLIS